MQIEVFGMQYKGKVAIGNFTPTAANTSLRFTAFSQLHNQVIICGLCQVLLHYFISPSSFECLSFLRFRAYFCKPNYFFFFFTTQQLKSVEALAGGEETTKDLLSVI